MSHVGDDRGAVREDDLSTRPVDHGGRRRDDARRSTAFVEDLAADAEVGHRPPTARGRHRRVERQRLAFQPGDEVVGQLHPLGRRTQHELAGMKDEHRLFTDLDQLGEVLLVLLHVDVAHRVVAEDPEVTVDVQVDRRGLNGGLVERLDGDSALGQGLPDRPV